MAQKYDDNSIDQLVGADRVRRRPAAMLGSNGLQGAQHGFTEIYGNALDEVTSGYGSRLDVVMYEDGSMSLRDYGRGVPLGWNEKWKRYNWHIVYNELYGGGKYNTNQNELRAIKDWSKFNPSDFNYLWSVGLNGLGAASTQYTSSFFTVKSFRDGVCTEMKFEHGLPVIDGKPTNVFDGSYDHTRDVASKFETDESNGTFIHWKPDDAVFTDTNIKPSWLFEICRDIAHVSHVDLHFEDKINSKVVDIAAGSISELLADRCGHHIVNDGSGVPTVFECNGFGHGDIVVEGAPYVWVCQVAVAFAFTTEKTSNVCYHNSVRMGAGVQYEAVTNALRAFFSEMASAKNIKLQASDYDSVCSAVVSTYSNYASFKGQTKDEVDNQFIYDEVYNALYNKLKMEYGKGTPTLMDAIDRVIAEAETRIAIAEAAKQIKAINKANKALKDPLKFHTCKEYLKGIFERTELWITEGDSAQGAVDKARNSDFQASYPVKGKCLNVLKATLDKILKNEEIMGIFALLGTNMDIGRDNMFDITKLKFNKIVFATDADEDGFQIRVLLFLIFYKLAPDLIRQGHVFIAETPRFALKYPAGVVRYARTDVQRDEYLAEFGPAISISRFKGLGEVDPAILRETTVHPDTRNLVPLTMDTNDADCQEIIDALFGADKFKRRKEILTAVLGEDVTSSMGEDALNLFDDTNSDEDDDDSDYEAV